MRFLLIPILGLVAAVTLLAETAEEKERQRLAGTWQLESIEVGGNKVENDDLKKISLTFRDGVIELQIGPDVKDKGMTFLLDVTKTPKTIDMTPSEGQDKDQVKRGIYKLEEGTMTLCLALKGDTRPTEFSTQQGDNFVLAVLRKQKK